MVRKVVLSLIAVLGAIAVSLGQNRQVAGTVTGADGSPIAGATIMVEGTTTGTTSGADGKFALAAPSDATLSVSFIGYETQRIPVAGKSHIAVVLEDDATSIDNVVVIGYGTGRKVGTVIGSVDQVKSDKLENRPSNNIMDAMQGQVAGLSISTSNGELNTTSTIRIHGMGSLSAGDEPLILLDGAPITSGTLMAMNQNDIESINVLKDASATSIYGARAANGVIYVTTKRGARGQEDVEVTLRASYSMSSATQPRLTPMNTTQYLNYMSDYMPALYGDMMAAYGYNDGRKFAIDFLGIDSDVNVNWYDKIISKNAPMYQIDLAVSGGSKKTSYYFSGNYSDQEGILPGSKQSRYTFRSNIDTKATDWLKVGMNLALGYQDSSMASSADTEGSLFTSNPMFASFMIPSWQPFKNADGKMLEFLGLYGDANPLVTPRYTPRTANRLQINGSTFVEITPVQGLTVRSALSANAFDYRGHTHFSPLWPTSSGVSGSGSASESFQRSYNWTWTNTAEYLFTVADEHNINVLLGQETLYSSGELFGVAMKGLTNDRFMTINQGTELSGLPSYSNSRYAYNSVFGRVEYNYDNRYFVDGLVRNDACSRFGANKRNGLFWAAGAMWKISQEAFLRDNATVTDLSLKVSYGTQGNSGIGNYAQYEYLSSGYPYGGLKSWAIANPGNPDLGWEKQSTLTVGASVSLWNKLDLGVEWYRRQTDDLLMPMPKAPSSGYSSITSNIGAMRNSGVDVTLNYNILQNKDWFVNFHATFNYNKNQLVKLWDPKLKKSVAGDMMYYVVGQAYPTFYCQEWRGVNPETGDPQWTAADGGITNDFNEAVLVNLDKSPQAPFTGGFGVSATWKGLSLIADFSWVAGNYMVNNNLYFWANTDFAAGYNQVTEVLDYWKKPGDRTKYPRLGSSGTQFDSRLIEDASFLRLKNIQIAYTLPKSLLNKTRFIKGLKVYVGARNLWTLTGYNGLDPEVTENVFDTDVYPNMRQWTFGCEFKF